jgi:archaellum component FlaC|tara:strand:- start:271 stop:531 length:261 start_codon:yes stop_codon:yes gene_type:complete
MKRKDLQIGKIERGQNGMKTFNSKDLAEDVEFLKMTIKNLEKTISDLEKKIISLEYSCDTNSNEIEALNVAVDDMEPDISEVEYPK